MSSESEFRTSPRAMVAMGAKPSERRTLAGAWAAACWGAWETERPVLVWRSVATIAEVTGGVSTRSVNRHMAKLADLGLLIRVVDLTDADRAILGPAVRRQDGAWVDVALECQCGATPRECRCRVLVPLDVDGKPTIALPPRQPVSAPEPHPLSSRQGPPDTVTAPPCHRDSAPPDTVTVNQPSTSTKTSTSTDQNSTGAENAGPTGAAQVTLFCTPAIDAPSPTRRRKKPAPLATPEMAAEVLAHLNSRVAELRERLRMRKSKGYTMTPKFEAWIVARITDLGGGQDGVEQCKRAIDVQARDAERAGTDTKANGWAYLTPEAFSYGDAFCRKAGRWREDGDHVSFGNPRGRRGENRSQAKSPVNNSVGRNASHAEYLRQVEAGEIKPFGRVM